MMDYINLVVSVFSLLAAIASAIAAWQSAISAKNTSMLAREALIKRAQSEKYLEVLLELGRVSSLVGDCFDNSPSQSDADFIKVCHGKPAANLQALLKELAVLSPKFAHYYQGDGYSELKKRLECMSSDNYRPEKKDVELLKTMIGQLQTCQRDELKNP